MAILFDPVGQCIYCGSDNDLTDEHIIPIGLGGKHVLPKSSCKPCAKITGRFEGVVLRSVYGDVRMRHNLPTRRRGKRPKSRLINTADGPKAVPTAEYPAPLALYQFGTCGLFLGAPPMLVLPHHNLTMCSDETHDAFKERHRWDGVMQLKFQPDEFRKMLLKVGHGIASVFMGGLRFKPIAVPYFMTEGKNLSYLVGQYADIQPHAKGTLHNIGLRTQVIRDIGTFLIADVRLFAYVNSPTYHVVVGQFEHLEDVSAVLKKLRDTGGEEVSFRAA